MYLSRVELHGFKSFADKTSFDLDRGITAILGPNGCGKSNVVDAIKWVLGESSAKNLRGSNMQDVIFAGSEGRRPTGMAEVSLFFNNEDGTLPIEYNEVCVTRRLYRSGESEYFINKQACRRRDIRDLFLDTGVGMSAYSFIEQGRVEALLQAKPAERRLVLEEAAGISKYKQRRKETLARLERTNQYLFRVNDIVEELDKNIRRVSRQAQSARRWQQLKGELDGLRTLHYTRSYNDQLVRLDEIERERSEIEQLFSREAAAQAQATEEITALTTQEMDLAEKVEGSEREFREIQNELNQVQIELAAAASRRESLTGEGAEAQRRAEQLRERLAQVAGLQEQAGLELEEARADYQRHNDALGGQDGERSQMQVALDETERRIEALRNEVLGISQRRSELRAQQVRSESRLAGLRERLQQLLARAGGIGAQEAELNAEIAGLRARLSQTAERIGTLNGQISAAKDEERGLREEATATERRAGEINARISAKESRRATLQDLENELDGAFAGVKAALQGKQQNDPQCAEIEGMVADLITVPQEYALAIETVLGGQAQDIIVRTARGAQQCIQYLKNNRAGRATFLPLDNIRARGPLAENLLKLPGVVGEAFELVDFADKYQPAMEYLLNGVLIVNDLNVARELSAGAARGVRIVTLDGDIINPHGAMTGGQGKQQRGGLISRKAEKDALVGEIEGLRRDLAEAGQRQAQLLEKARGLAAGNPQIEQELSEALKLGRELETAVSVKESQARRVTEDRVNFDTERAGLETEIAALESGAEDFGLEAQIIDEDERSAQHGLEAALAQQRQARAELEKLGEALAGVREKRAAAQSLLNELERRLDSLRRDRQEREEELQRCLQTAERAGFGCAEIVARVEELTGRERILLERRDTAQTGDVGDRERLKEIRETLEQLRNQEKSSQRRMNEVTAALNELKIRQSEVSLKMENISEKAQAELAITDLRERAVEFARKAEPVISAVTGEEMVREDAQEEKGILRTADGTPVTCLSGEQLAGHIRETEVKLERLGPVNMCAIDELAELEARAEFLRTEQDDIRSAADNLLEVIERLNDECNKRFEQTFVAVREHFQEMFRFLFGGGRADLVMEEPEAGQDKLDAGINIIARPPGKEPKSISLLSGGEKALCAVALLFAIFRSKPSPFCILDEVDGPLDESNIDRFMSAVRNFTDETQFILISHSKRTMSMTDTIYGVTQQQPGVSTKYSLRFKDASRKIAGGAPEESFAEAEAKLA